MPRILETSERASTDLLKTRWYRNNYTQAKEAVKKVAVKLEYRIISENDNFGEIVIKSKNFHVTLKIYQMLSVETSVDIFIECLSFFEFGKNKKQIELFYNELGKLLQFKGLALHP